MEIMLWFAALVVSLSLGVWRHRAKRSA